MKLYSWWSKYMFWCKSHGFPWSCDSLNHTSLIIGHRGSSEKYPENTMLAFKKAEEEGAHGIELDIHQSSDGEYVIIHDLRVDRTTTHTGDVSGFTLAELTNMDAGAWKGSQFAGLSDTKIPSLETVLNYFKGKNMFIFLHDYTTDPVGLIDYVQSKGMSEQCVYFGTPAKLETVLRYSPNTIAVNDGYRTDFENLLSLATSQGWSAIGYDWGHITASVVKQAHEAGILLQATLLYHSFESKTREFILAGVDWIMGDDCGAMVSTFNSFGLTQSVPGDFTTKRYNRAI